MQFQAKFCNKPLGGQKDAAPRETSNWSKRMIQDDDLEL
jgi:hypothetical protein